MYYTLQGGNNMKEQIEVPVINLQEVGTRIRRLRKAQKLKVTDISDRMGFTGPQAVYKWQRGDCLPDVGNLIMLSRMLGTTVEGIILGDEEISSPHVYQQFILLNPSLVYLINRTLIIT